jgi:hypothetical protein
MALIAAAILLDSCASSDEGGAIRNERRSVKWKRRNISFGLTVETAKVDS